MTEDRNIPDPSPFEVSEVYKTYWFESGDTYAGKSRNTMKYA
jgi:hypothetical protein